MTAIFYPDCTVTSGSGRFTLEARSPHNGTIRHRDGREPSESEFGFKYREHQSEFRYRLLDTTPRGTLGQLLRGREPRIVWERWQQEREDSPGELVVSEDGWSVIRTHGFRPEVIAVAPDGRDVVRVRATWADGEDTESAPNGPTPVDAWPLEHLSLSTAGHYWAEHSWRYFFHWREEPYFAWRTSWGQRLVIDLSRGVAFTAEQRLPEGLADGADSAEGEGVTALLGVLSGQMNEVRALLDRRGEDEERESSRLVQWVRQASAALHLVGVHRLSGCIPYLREWEPIDWPSMSTGSSAMPGRWWLQTQHLRPIVHHALKLLGEEPLGFPTYRFTAGGFDAPEVFPMPERLADRRQRVERLSFEMSAEEVLSLLGSPDFICRQFQRAGKPGPEAERWEYDFRTGASWTTLQLMWEERHRGEHLAAIDWVAPYWLEGTEREAEYLRF
jgi:hypothetical protein